MNEPKPKENNEQVEHPPELTPEDEKILDAIWDNLDNETEEPS